MDIRFEQLDSLHWLWFVFVLVTLYWGVSGLVKVNEFLYFNF